MGDRSYQEDGTLCPRLACRVLVLRRSFSCLFRFRIQSLFVPARMSDGSRGVAAMKLAPETKNMHTDAETGLDSATLSGSGIVGGHESGGVHCVQTTGYHLPSLRDGACTSLHPLEYGPFDSPAQPKPTPKPRMKKAGTTPNWCRPAKSWGTDLARHTS